MDWKTQRAKLDVLISDALLEESCLDLPVVEPGGGIDSQFDILDFLVSDALLKDEVSPLPVVDPKIVQWIDYLEEVEDKPFNTISDAEPRQQAEPEKEEQIFFQVNAGIDGQQCQLQPENQDTDICVSFDGMESLQQDNGAVMRSKIEQEPAAAIRFADALIFQKDFSNYRRHLQQSWKAQLTSPDCIDLEEYVKRLQYLEKPHSPESP